MLDKHMKNTMPNNIRRRQPLRSSEWLRENIFPTLDRSERLLDALRHGWPLRTVEREAAWLLLSDQVYAAARRHYKQAQSYGTRVFGRAREWYEVPDPNNNGYDRYIRGYDAHTERILLLVEWLKTRKDKSVGWCIFSWKRRFAQFETIRQLRSYGVYVPVEHAQRIEIRLLTLVESLKREYRRVHKTATPTQKNMLDYWQQKTGSTDEQRERFQRQWDVYVVSLWGKTRDALSWDVLQSYHVTDYD